jgi:hypothetical protein
MTSQHITAQQAQHSTGLHSTAHDSTSQHMTAQHSTAQHSTAQHSTAHDITAYDITSHHMTSQHRWRGVQTLVEQAFAVVQRHFLVLLRVTSVTQHATLTRPLHTLQSSTQAYMYSTDTLARQHTPHMHTNHSTQPSPAPSPITQHHHTSHSTQHTPSPITLISCLTPHLAVYDHHRARHVSDAVHVGEYVEAGQQAGGGQHSHPRQDACQEGMRV